ncbi:MAG: spore maturation protein [Clostridia bacterium]|nr:spore maturation protein [Clostridia bacterium]
MQRIEVVFSYILPCVVALVAIIILFGKKDYFRAFLSGGSDGALTSLKLLPTMCALIVGVNMLRASGALAIIEKILRPVFDFIGVPTEILPLILTRPISGSASLATFNDIISTYGPDSLPALCASIIMASSDTVIYVICIYFSTVKIRRTRYALPVALFLSCLCIILSCILCRVFLNN